MILQSRPTAGRPDAPDPYFRTSAVLSGLAPRSEHVTLSDDTSPSVTRETGYGLQVDDTPSIEIAPSANAIATALQNTLVPRKRLLTHHTTRAHTHKLEQHGTEANGILSSRITGSGAFHSDEQTSPPIFDRRTAALDMASLTDHDLTTASTTTTVHTPILSNDTPPMATNTIPGGATATTDAQTTQQIAQMEDMIQQLLIQQDLIQQPLAQQQQQPMLQSQPLQQEQQQPPQQPQQQHQQEQPPQLRTAPETTTASPLASADTTISDSGAIIMALQLATRIAHDFNNISTVPYSVDIITNHGRSRPLPNAPESILPGTLSITELALQPDHWEPYHNNTTTMFDTLAAQDSFSMTPATLPHPG